MQRLWLLKNFSFGVLWQLKSMHIQHPWCILRSFTPVYSFTENRSFILSLAPRVEFHIFPYPNCLLFLLLGNKTHWKQRFGDANFLNPIDKQVWLQLHSALGLRLSSPGLPSKFILRALSPPSLHTLVCHVCTVKCAKQFSCIVHVAWVTSDLSESSDSAQATCSGKIACMSSCRIRATPCVPVWTDTSSCPFF